MPGAQSHVDHKKPVQAWAMTRQPLNPVSKKLIVLALLVILAGLGLRCMLFLHLEPYSPQFSETLLVSDAANYAMLAKNLAAKNSFSTDGQTPHTVWVPGYPLFASLFFRWTSSPVEWVIIAQILLSMIGPALFYGLAGDLFRPWTRFAIAAILMLEPNAIIFSNLFMSETLFLAFMLLFITFYLRYLRFHKPGELIIAALLLGLATLTRAVAQYLFLLVALHLLLYMRSKSDRKRIGVALAGFLLAYAAVVTPWMARNYHDFGFFSLSSGAGHNLLKNNVTVIECIRLKKNIQATRQAYLAQAQKNLTPQEAQNPFRLDQAKLAFALEKIARDPCFYLSGHLAEMRRILLDSSEFILFFNNYLRIPVFSEKTIRVMVGGQPRLLKQTTLKPHFALIKEILSLLLTGAACLLAAYLPANLIYRDRRFACMTFFLILILYFPLLSSASAPSRFRIPIIAPMIMAVACAMRYFCGLYEYIRDRAAPCRQTQGTEEVKTRG
jgi:4-amino-4-deoxy-L-arabinose transferase-like glycosyltransferase